MRIRFRCLWCLVLVFLVVSSAERAFADTRAVAASGRDRNNKIDKWRDDKVDGFCNGVKKSDPNADCRKPKTKADFLQELEDAAKELECGDDLVIYYNGHGGRGKLCFVREGKSVSTKDILDALKDLACCVKVRIVIHACYSGSHIEELAKDPHVKAIYTSCAADETGKKDIYPIHQPTCTYEQTPLDEDWPSGFEEDLNDLPDGTPIDEALEEASKSARTKTNEIIREKTTPQSWVRKPVEIKAHVEKVISPRLVKVHIWEPNSMHCQTKTIWIPEGVTIPEGLKHCDWITAPVSPVTEDRVYLDPNNRNDPNGEIVTTDPPVIDIKGHVEWVRSNKIEVHIWEPEYLRCNKKKIALKEGTELPEGLKHCDWITVSATVTDPDGNYQEADVNGVNRVDPPTTEIWGHVRYVKKSAKVVGVHVWEPVVWRCKIRKIKFDNLPEGLKKCMWIKVTVSITDPDGTTVPATGGVQVVSPPQEEIYGHVYEVNLKAKPPYVRVKVESPPGLKGRRIKIEADEIPAWLQYCEWITVTVDLTDPKGGTAELPDGGTFGNPPRRRFHAHVKWVHPDGEWIYVHIRQPKSMKCQHRRITDGPAMFAGLEACNTIVANVTSEGITIVGTKKYKTYKAEWVRRASLVRNPDNYAPHIYNGYVVPESGGTLTGFQYFATYFDVDNDPPVTMSVHIDDEYYGMYQVDPADDDYTDGAVFAFETRLSEGIHNFHFEAYDGLAMTTLPAHDQVWSFTVADCLILDDFEQYDDDPYSTSGIFQTWIDGLGYELPPPGHPGNGTGSMVWLWTYHDGDKAMIFEYDNIFPPHYSETGRTWESSQDWTRESVQALSLWFQGDPFNDPEQMYVAVEDIAGNVAVVRRDDADAMLSDSWQEWNIDLREFGDADVDLANVQAMYIGVGERDNPQPDGAGMLSFDDIRLCRPRCLQEYRPAGDLNNDCVVDYRDLKIMIDEWLGSLGLGFGLEADLYEDSKIDFKDLAVLADTWVEDLLWPPPLSPDVIHTIQ